MKTTLFRYAAQRETKMSIQWSRQSGGSGRVSRPYLASVHSGKVSLNHTFSSPPCGTRGKRSQRSLPVSATLHRIAKGDSRRNMKVEVETVLTAVCAKHGSSRLTSEIVVQMQTEGPLTGFLWSFQPYSKIFISSGWLLLSWKRICWHTVPAYFIHSSVMSSYPGCLNVKHWSSVLSLKITVWWINPNPAMKTACYCWKLQKMLLSGIVSWNFKLFGSIIYNKGPYLINWSFVLYVKS